jgi:uncharacterized repeat protein (TIGR03803 family)
MPRPRQIASALCGIPFLLVLLSANMLAANTPRRLHAFGISPGDGSSLYSSLTRDARGNLYGTSVDGGTAAAGTVFKLTPTKNGTWKETVLYSFTGGADGANPHSAVVIDNAGNLYGTTVSGGLVARVCNAGCGVVYKLSLIAGKWTETVLYQFTGGTDGGTLYAGPVFDSSGTLYGVSQVGGAKGFGTVYQLSPASGGAWQFSVLYNFGGKPNAASAYATPIFDAAGNLYGTTYEGGTNGKGTVYELSKNSSGAWVEQILCSFQGGSDGSEPFAGLILDRVGNLYGATLEGGTANVGTAFKLTAADNWKKTILHQFLGLSAADGANPNTLVFDANGNLYGTTVGGGQFNPGTIFRLSSVAGQWKETVLYSFTGGLDGAYPSAGLTIDPAGHLFGTTLWGGPAGDTIGGVAFEFVP